MGPGARRLAGHAPRPVHRRDARCRALHRRRSALLDRSGRRPEHAVARRRRAPSPPRSVRPCLPRAGGAKSLRRAGRSPGAAARGHRDTRGRAEIRRDLAGPLAVSVVAEALALADTEPRRCWAGTTRSSPRSIGSRPAARSVGRAEPPRTLDRHVAATIQRGLRRARRRDRDARAGRDRLERGGHDVRWDRDQRGHDDQPVLAPPDPPAQLAAVRADRSLLPNAVEESLRLEPAAARVDRYATADAELGGATIEGGDLVIVSLTAANRDPETFPEPDAFEVSRANARAHLAFAQGPHACVGSIWPGWRRDRPSKRPSTTGPTSSSNPGRRRRAESSSGNRGRCRSAGRSDPTQALLESKRPRVELVGKDQDVHARQRAHAP